MTNPAEDLHRKPYTNTEDLFAGILWAMETYGKCKYPKGVIRPTFLFTPDPGEFGGRPSWSLLAKLEVFGDITPAQGADRVQVQDLVTEPVATERWEVKERIIYLAGERLRVEISAALEDFLSEKRAEVISAEQALNALRLGVSPEALWPEPAQAEATLEAIVENPELAVAPSPVTVHLDPDD